MSVLVKDPLQVEPSPFELLGVGVEARAAEVEARFKACLPGLRDQRRRRAAMVARGALKDPVERELACLFHYDERSGLRPCPVGDPGALQPARRAETAAAWEQQLRASMSDVGIAHGLAVLWYWSAVHDAPDPAPARRSVAYWAMLASNDAFWGERRLGPVEDEVRERVITRLRGDLRPAPGIEDVLASELASARKIAEAGVFLGGEQVFGGRLLLEHLGLADAVRSQRQDLPKVLDPLGEIEDLIARGKVDTALKEIDNLPREPAVDDLRARGLIARAGQLASVRADDAAMDALELAIGAAHDPEVAAAVRGEVASICCGRAAALGPEEAIVLLECGRGLVPEDQRVALALADRLTTRAIAAINAAVEERPTDAVAAVEGGAAQLERAARLGSQAAAEQLAWALFSKGVTLGALGRSEEAVVVYGNVVARFGDPPAPELREWVAKALYSKGFELGSLERAEEEVLVYEEVVARFGDAPAPELRECVAAALVNKGLWLGTLERWEEEVIVYEEVLARFGDAPAPKLREWVARALVNKGAGLGALGRSEEAVVVYDEIVARFGDAPETELHEQVARTLVNKGAGLGELGRVEEAVIVYDEVVARFGDVPEPKLRELVGMALVNKGKRLGALERWEKAVVVCDEVVARFDDAPEPELRELVAQALLGRGVGLGALGRWEEAVVGYEEVVARFGDAPEPELREWVDRARRASELDSRNSRSWWRRWR